MKYRNRLAKLEARRKAFAVMKPKSGMTFHRPGSQRR